MLLGLLRTRWGTLTCPLKTAHMQGSLGRGWEAGKERAPLSQPRGLRAAGLTEIGPGVWLAFGPVSPPL